jgi:hypothetical protein
LRPYTCLLCLGHALQLLDPSSPAPPLQTSTNFAEVRVSVMPPPPLCPFVGCSSYYGHCCSIWKSVYILKTRNQKKKKKNSEKQKKLLLFQESPPWMFLYCITCISLQKEKKEEKILIMANCCSILQVSVHFQKRGQLFFKPEKPKINE